MQVRVEYKPTPKQQMFHKSPADILLYGGAAGGGKSKACVMDALFRCLRHPRTHAYLFRRSYPELKDTLIKEARASIPKELGRYRESDHDFVLYNGSVLHFRHCLREADMHDYQGCEIDWLYVDELTSFSKTIFDYLRTRLRTKTTSNIKPVVRCTSNPGNVGHAWVKAMFVDSAEYFELHTVEVYSRELDKTRVYRIQYIPAYATDNPHIGKDYIFELEMKPEALRKALLNGDWDAFEGQAFPEFTDNPEHYHDGYKTHVINPIDIPDWWPRYRSFDHGYSRPFSVGWWAIDPQGRMYRYKEWYGCARNLEGLPEADTGMKLTPKQIAQGIKQMEEYERQRGITVYGVCDPALDDRSTGPSIMDSMAEEGIYFQKGDHKRMAGKMQFHERLRFRPDGKPMMYVFKECKDFIRLTKSLCYDQIKIEDVNTKSEDHSYDETRYMFMMFPIVAVEPKYPKQQEYNPLAGNKWRR